MTEGTSNRRLRIAFVISGLEVGGAEQALLKILPRFSRDIDARVISMTTIGPLGQKLKESGIHVDAIGMTRGIASISGLMRLRAHLKNFQPDIVQTVMYHADLVGGLAAKLSRVPRVAWWIHNSGGAMHALNPLTRVVIRLCAAFSRRVPDLILCCSEKARLNHASFGYDDRRIEVLPNGFDLSRFRPDPRAGESVRVELGLPADTPLIGVIARFDPQKDHAGFLQAAQRVHQSRTDVRFLMVGADVQSSNLTLNGWIKDAGLESVVHLLGPRDDVPRLMAALTFLASTSIAEAFPSVIGEAMACEVPCVVTDVGDSALIVGETGLIVPHSNPDRAARAWLEVLALSPAERSALGAAARRRVADKFELESLVSKQEKIYRRLADAAADPRAEVNSASRRSP